jgi:hypothetical protein
MRENRPYGSEGGEAKSLPYPYRADRLVVALDTSKFNTPFTKLKLPPG